MILKAQIKPGEFTFTKKLCNIYLKNMSMFSISVMQYVSNFSNDLFSILYFCKLCKEFALCAKRSPSLRPGGQHKLNLCRLKLYLNADPSAVVTHWEWWKVPSISKCGNSFFASTL